MLWLFQSCESAVYHASQAVWIDAHILSRVPAVTTLGLHSDMGRCSCVPKQRDWEAPHQSQDYTGHLETYSVKAVKQVCNVHRTHWTTEGAAALNTRDLFVHFLMILSQQWYLELWWRIPVPVHLSGFLLSWAEMGWHLTSWQCRCQWWFTWLRLRLLSMRTCLRKPCSKISKTYTQTKLSNQQGSIARAHRRHICSNKDLTIFDGLALSVWHIYMLNHAGYWQLTCRFHG